MEGCVECIRQMRNAYRMKARDYMRNESVDWRNNIKTFAIKHSVRLLILFNQLRIRLLHYWGYLNTVA
jgi:hypothetical protein